MKRLQEVKWWLLGSDGMSGYWAVNTQLINRSRVHTKCSPDKWYMLVLYSIQLSYKGNLIRIIENLLRYADDH